MKIIVTGSAGFNGRPICAGQGPWRPGDQRIFIADTTMIAQDLGWKPRTTAEEGIVRLVDWVRQSAREIEDVVADACQRV